MGGHHLIELDLQGTYEDKLTSKTTTFVDACYGSKVEGHNDYSPLLDVEV